MFILLTIRLGGVDVERGLRVRKLPLNARSRK
jgi:hypothetical protein